MKKETENRPPGISVSLRTEDRLPLFFRHLVLDETDDSHENRAPNPATAGVGQDALQVHSSATGSGGTHHGLEDRAAKPTADNSRERISDRDQTFSFIAAPATLPPTAPLTASTIKLVISIVIFLGLFSVLLPRLPCKNVYCGVS